MTIGKRISKLRKTANYSQEYIAQQLEVSRQAVSKWEQDISSPSTDNLIRLAALLDSSVEYIATGKAEFPENQPAGPKRKKLTKRQIRNIVIVCVVVMLVAFGIGTASYIYTRPVDWDAGACSGGYVTYIFDQYSGELTQKFLDGMGAEKEKVVSMEAVRGSQSAQWEDKEIFLEFDVRYEHREYGIVTEKIRFIGKRVWIDTFDWSGAIIVG